MTDNFMDTATSVKAGRSESMSSAPSEQLKIVIVGHVDHGKSTFVGRLFHDTGMLPEGKLEQLQNIAERRGVPFEWANLMDALQSERDQNITIDTAQIWFQTKKRQYVIIDAPGHKEFLKNMVTGAANAEAALLVIDSAEGVQEQSRRHGYLLHLLGIRQIAVLVNKMDLQNYSQERFNQIEKEFRGFLKSIGLEAKIFIPIAAKHGVNIATLSEKTPWWTGPTVVEALDQFKVSELPKDQPLRFPIQDVYRFDERRILAGRVESGSIKVGDRLLFSPGRKVSTVKTIERWNAPSREIATAGESIGITLTEQIFIERGAVASLETAPPYELTRFKARLFWLGRAPFAKSKIYKLKLTTQEVDCEIDAIDKVIDASTLETISRKQNELFVGRHEVAELSIRTRRPVAFDLQTEIVPTGRFVIVDGFEVCGGGIILLDSYPTKRAPEDGQKAEGHFSSHGKLTAEQRARRNGHPGCVVWLTGLPGSGKSDIATELERELFNMGKQAYVLDADNIRHGLCSNLTFSPHDRKETIRRVGEVAKLFSDAGIICITAFISPYRSDRQIVRETVPDGQFVEVYVNASLEFCAQRDFKGLPIHARANELKEFAGSSAPYEAPLAPEIELHTERMSVGESVARILEYLHLLDVDTTISI